VTVHRQRRSRDDFKRLTSYETDVEPYEETFSQYLPDGSRRSRSNYST